ncbi:sodium:solute symporter family transporter [Rickettsiales endosymbiont of Peranema trichophorum]|uniref:sodium:solute symporter family transporter n=1 Tax=Rickettsiales endosymbiont of Peranema trichophorum TaxID=2486577 RepID=UPI0013EEBAB0|nr:ATP-binding protein [Rickettsiales endosymbiont of Peranema trichophorum]
MQNYLELIRPDLLIVFFYLVACLVLGFYKVGTLKNIKEYTLGTGGFTNFALIATLFATYIGAASTTGTIEEVYNEGVLFIIIQAAEPIPWFIAAYVFGRNIEQFRGCISISDIMTRLYGAPGKWVTNVSSILLSLGVVTAQVTAIGYVSNALLGVSNLTGVLVGFGIVTLYSIFGGIRSVVATDILQFIVFYIALPILCIISLQELGGLAVLAAKLPPSHLTLDFSGQKGVMFAALLFNYLCLPAVASGTFIQRFLMAQSSKQLTYSLIIVALMAFSLNVIICLIGLVVRVKNPDLDSGTVFFHFITTNPTLSTWMVGLIIAGILAAIMSTADSWLNTTAVLCAHDIAKTVLPNLTSKQELLIARLSTLTISVVSIFIALKVTAILSFLWFIWNFWDPLILMPLIVGFLRFRTNSFSFIISCIFAVLSIAVVAYFLGTLDLITSSAGMMGSCVGLFVGHYVQVYLGVEMPTPPIAPITRTRWGLHTLVAFFKYLSPSGMMYTSKVLLAKSMLPHYVSYIIIFLYSTYVLTQIYEPLTGPLSRNLIIQLYLINLSVSAIGIIRELIDGTFLRRYVPLYWAILMTLALPLASVYGLLLKPFDSFYVINFIISTFVFALLVDLRAFLTLGTVGVLIASGAYTLLQPGPKFHIEHLSVISAILYSMFGIVTAILVKQFQLVESLKLKIFGGAIAHEVRSPFINTQASVSLLNSLLKRAVQRSQSNANVSLLQDDVEEMLELLEETNEISKEGLDTIDMLLARIRGENGADDVECYVMRKCIKSALLEHQFKNYLNNIRFDQINDFTFKGSWKFVRHVLINIISNAVKYGGPNVLIHIRMEDHTVFIRDNGKGISPEVLPYIFDMLYSGEKGGTGIGLAFCKDVMEQLGGGIRCISELGEYTEFILSFPEVGDDTKR